MLAGRSLAVMERAGNLLLADVRTVVTFDQQCDSPAIIDVTRPCQRAVERIEFLVQQSVLFPAERSPAILADRCRFGRSSSSSGCNLTTTRFARSRSGGT